MIEFTQLLYRNGVISMRFKRLVALCLSFLLVCTSTVFAAEKYSLEDMLEFIASPEMKGRLIGTEGNETVMTYIRDRFEEVGLLPFDEDYYHENTQRLHLPENAYEKLIVTYRNGSTEEFEFGNDFLFTTPVEKIDITAEVTYDTADPNLSEKILVIPEGDSIYKYYRSCKGVLVESNSFFRARRVFERRPATASITPELFEKFKDETIETITLACEYIGQEVEVNNVVGKLKGEDSSKAIVISAHFDHVGWAGDKIFNGALDNGSGVIALLDLADKLSNYTKNNTLPIDVILVAFNGEDSYLPCSYDFVVDLEKQYDSFYDINIDCIGLIKGGNLSASGDPILNGELINDLIESFEDSGVVLTDEFMGVSDNINFNRNGYSGINIGNTAVYGENGGITIHTPDDTVDVVDLGEVAKIVDAVFNFITTSEGNTYKTYVKIREEKRDKALIDYSLENTMDFVAGDETMGRLVGSGGNRIVQEFIAQEFGLIGLDYYDEDYYHSIGMQTAVNPGYITENLSVTYKDGTVKKAINGKDFMAGLPVENMNFASEITFDVDDPQLAEKILVLPKGEKPYMYIQKAKSILYVKDVYTRYAGGSKQDKAIIQISQNFYNHLVEEKIEKISLNYSYYPMPVEIFNVAGKITGKDSSRAVVISAHFDHVGAISNDVIFNGAVDNGSGVTALIDLARKLKQQSLVEPFETDIILVGFNAEEYMFPEGGFLLGSDGFVKDLATRYDNFYNINIDTIGHISKANLSICTNPELGTAYQDIMNNFLDEKGLKADNIPHNGSDEMSFNKHGFSGITIGGNFEGVFIGKNAIHSAGDKPEYVNFEEIKQVIDAVYDFILKYDGTIFEVEVQEEVEPAA